MYNKKPGIIWANLLDEKCPKCGQLLTPDTDYFKCGVYCGFVIRAEKYFEMRQTLEKKNQGKITHVAAILPNGKVKFKAAKTFHGERPAQNFNLGF